MEIKRREFVKGFLVAGALSLPGISLAMQSRPASKVASSRIDSHIEKSIKAGFGGGFSLKAHRQANGLTYADIEHSGNRYSVASADLLDWKILSAA